MPLSKSADKIAWDDLFSATCAACGNKKKVRQSFCGDCYYSLPQKTRNELYKGFASGYADIYAGALEWLRENK